MFVECGPGSVLTGLAGHTLAGLPHLALASDAKGRPGLVQLAHLLGQLLAAGVPAKLDRLFQGRGVVPQDPARLTPETGKPKPPPTAWVVNGIRSRPVNGPEPRLLGQPLPADHAKQPRKVAELPKPAAPAAPPAAPARAVAVTPAAPKLETRNSKLETPRAVAPVTPRAPMHTTESAPAPSANGHHPHPAPAPAGAAEVMMRFQDVMARFLETQRSVMLGFLGSPAAPAAAPAVPLPNVGYAPLPAVNGSVHSNGHYPLPAAAAPAVPAVVNRFAAPAPGPVAKPTAPAPVAPAAQTTTAVARPEPAPVVAVIDAPKPAALDRETLLARLLDLVSERTGYPKEALSIDLDLEADLGVDSIKRVEVLGCWPRGSRLGRTARPRTWRWRSCRS